MHTSESLRTVCSRALRCLTAMAAVASLSACDFKVTNPGPTADTFLSDTLSLNAQVTGIAYSLGDGMNYQVLQGAIVARELFPTGQSGQFGIEPRNWVGYLVTEEQGAPWNSLSQSRWLSDQALARLQNALGDAYAKHPLVAQALVWRGFTYRLLGESMCVSVIDGGPPTPSRDNLIRADSAFTAAIAVATAAGNQNLVTAAYAGRAQVRVDLNDWKAAVADAANVPTSFKYQMPYFTNVDEYGYNRTMWSSSAQSFYKSTSVWGTWYADYYDATRDPRVPYTRTELVGTGSFPPVGKVPWWPQARYGKPDSPINLATGREARLIDAEAALLDGNVTSAMALIDANRASAGAPVVQRPGSLEDAWTILKRERGIELWLEGRRLGDMRRWAENDTPGALDPLEVVGDASHLEGQDKCFPLSQGEINTNPNVKP